MTEYTVVVGDQMYSVRVETEAETGAVRVALDGAPHERVRLEPWVGSTHFRLWQEGASVPVVIRGRAEEWLVEIADEQYRVTATRRLPIPRRSRAEAVSGGRDIAAPMPGLVVSVDVSPGQVVEQGQALVIVEAMKMQSELRSPIRGRVAAIAVRPGQEVMGGAVLVRIEPT